MIVTSESNDLQYYINDCIITTVNTNSSLSNKWFQESLIYKRLTYM